jgi:hypothetical protein
MQYETYICWSCVMPNIISNYSVEWMSDCCLTPYELVVSCIMARTSYIQWNDDVLANWSYTILYVYIKPSLLFKPFICVYPIATRSNTPLQFHLTLQSFASVNEAIFIYCRFTHHNIVSEHFFNFIMTGISHIQWNDDHIRRVLD